MIRKKYRLSFSGFKTIMVIVFICVVILITVLILISILVEVTSSIFSSRLLSEDFGGRLISLIPLGAFTYTTWREFRFPVLWISEEGITAIAIVFIPIQVTILWGNILALKEVFTLYG